MKPETIPMMLAAIFLPTINALAQFTDMAITTNSFDQSETAIAYSPKNGNNLIAGWNDWRTGTGHDSWCAFSTDGGLSWIERSVRTERTVDPSVGFDTSGRAFYCYLNRLNSRVTVSRTTNLGLTWFHKDVWQGASDDKPYMAIDNSGNQGNIYLSWTVIGQTTGRYSIRTARSTDQGATFTCINILEETEAGKGELFRFSDDVPTDPEKRGFPFVQASMPAVAPNGDVYVVWVHAEVGLNASYLRMARLTQEGCVFSVLSNPATLTWTEISFGNLEIVSIPSLAVDPVTGYLHIVYVDPQSEPNTDLRVKYIRSTNEGDNWSEPTILGNFGEGWQFFPWVSTDKTGRVSVSFMHRLSTSTTSVEAYVVESYDRGENFTEPIKVSAQSSSWQYSSQRHHYMGSTAQSGGMANVAWTDYRGLNPDIYYSQANTFTWLAGQNRSTSVHATLSNGQRKLVREPSGKLQLLFESGQEIFFRNSLDGGQTWQVPLRLSTGTGENQYPCITERNGYSYAVWQKGSGTNWDVLYSYSTNGGFTWLPAPITVLSNLSCTSTGPVPVIQAGAPANPFEVMIAYQTLSGVWSIRSTSYPLGGNWSTPISVSGVSNSAADVSLTYLPNSWAYYKGVWGQQGKIYYADYYQGVPGSWGTKVFVNSGTYGIITNEAKPCIATTAAPADRHVVWQGTHNGRGVIIANKNLSPVYYEYINANPNISYSSPSVTGHASGRASITWNDNIGNIYKGIYDGSWWGNFSVIGVGGMNTSSSIMNPSGGNAKVVWTQGTTPPYTLHIDGSLLSKPGGQIGSELTELTVLSSQYRRRIFVKNMQSHGTLSIDLSKFVLTRGEASSREIEFVPVNDTAQYTAQQIFPLLETDSFFVSEDVNAISVVRSIQTENIDAMANGARLRFELVNTRTGSVLASFGSVHLVEVGGRSRIDDTVTTPLPPLDQIPLKIRTTVDNLVLSGPSRVGAIVHVFITEGNGQGTQQVRKVEHLEQMLFQNYPNPFNPLTTISYTLSSDKQVTMRVFNVLGQEMITLVDAFQSAGSHQVLVDASRFPSGVYFYRLRAGEFVETRKFLLMR